MLKKLFIAFAVLVLLGIIGKFGTTNTLHEQEQDHYSSTWRGDVDIAISKALVTNDITGCGEFYYKQNLDQPSEYYVKCTGDGYNWTYYLVWTLSEKVLRVKPIP